MTTVTPVRIVSFSTGWLSALLVQHELNKSQGGRGVVSVFMDTKWEHPDNYRFRDELYKYWRAGWPELEIVEISDGRTVDELEKQEKVIFNQRLHPCTRILKIEPFMKYMADLNLPAALDVSGELATMEAALATFPNKNPKGKFNTKEGKKMYMAGRVASKKLAERGAVVCIGFDYSEIDRTLKSLYNYARNGYAVEFPLLDANVAALEAQIKGAGIEKPAMYSMGYSHANCGGRCRAQGVSDWLITLRQDSELFKAEAAHEAEMRELVGDYSILRDQTGGTVTSRPLSILWDDVASQEKRQPALSGFDCVQCGIGDLE